MDTDTPTRTETACFTTRGQLVIPARLRRQFHITDRTRVIITATPEGILLKPVTAAMVKHGFGLLKPRRAGPSFADDWAEDKRQERLVEEARHARHGS